MFITLIVAVAGAQTQPSETGGGFARTRTPNPVWTLYVHDGIVHRRVRYWRIQMSGLNMLMAETDFEARKYNMASLPAHLRPRSLDDLFIYAIFGESGWPMSALGYAADDVSQSSGSSKQWETIGTLVIGKHANGNPRVIPLRPVWLGLAVDTAFYGLLSLGCACGVGALRKMLRKRDGCCMSCGYDLTGISLPCPECGKS